MGGCREMDDVHWGWTRTSDCDACTLCSCDVQQSPARRLPADNSRWRRLSPWQRPLQLMRSTCHQSTSRRPTYDLRPATPWPLPPDKTMRHVLHSIGHVQLQRQRHFEFTNVHSSGTTVNFNICAVYILNRESKALTTTLPLITRNHSVRGSTMKHYRC